MTLELWLAYVVASAVVLVVPGPTIMLVVSYALAHGRGSAWRTVPGVVLGDLVAMTVSLAGLGAVLATAAGLFTVLKWAGALYLVYLGVRLWRAPAALGTARGLRRGGAMTGHAFAVTALNPKSIAFFVAFLPQFVNPAAAAIPQLVVLGATFLALALVDAVAYACLADKVRGWLGGGRGARLTSRAAGSVLIAAGLLTAAVRRPA